MPINPSNYRKDKDATILDLINQYNNLEDRFKKMERMLTIHPGDYSESTLLGVKTFEGKVETYNVSDILDLVDSIDPDDL
jgi:hypothetical protein